MMVWSNHHRNQHFAMLSSRPLRTRRNKLLFINLTIGAFFVVYFCVATFKTLHLLEKQRLVHGEGGVTNSTIISTSSSFNNNASATTVENSSASPGRFILFRKMGFGQGAGNVMNGLLAAHLFGQEFNRTVCVAEAYTQFHAAFEAIDPLAVQYCPDIRKSRVNKEHRLELVNFVSRGANECRVRDMLESDAKIIAYTGNTYPRWPHVERGFFFRFYRARPELLDILAYDHQHESPPSTVVHLRAPDPGGGDQRKGLDEDSLVALGEELPRNATFLVTNQVDWFKRFEEGCGWSHANWDSVAHSSSGSVMWTAKGDGKGLADGKLHLKNVPRGAAAAVPRGKLPNSLQEVNMKRGTVNTTAASAPAATTPSSSSAPVDHNMQMFADWFMLLQAKQVYHTNSDFSNSAVHWMDIDAFVIEGYNRTSHRLVLKRESWVVDGETPPLVDRTLEADESNPDKQLRMCPPKVPLLDQRTSLLGGIKKEAVHRKKHR